MFEVLFINYDSSVEAASMIAPLSPSSRHASAGECFTAMFGQPFNLPYCSIGALMYVMYLGTLYVRMYA